MYNYMYNVQLRNTTINLSELCNQRQRKSLPSSSNKCEQIWISSISLWFYLTNNYIQIKRSTLTQKNCTQMTISNFLKIRTIFGAR